MNASGSIARRYLGEDVDGRSLLRGLLVDGAVLLLAAVYTVVLLILSRGETVLWWTSVAGLAATALCLFFRRSAPATVVVIATGLGSPAIPFFAYTSGSRMRVWSVGIGAVSLAVLAGSATSMLTSFLASQSVGLSSLGLSMVVRLFLTAVPYLIGVFVGQRRTLVRSLRDRARQLERERLLLIRESRIRERGRIARDMHDSLGHHLTLLSLRIGALQVSPTLPEADRTTATGLHGMVHSAMEELRDIITVLRQDDEQQLQDQPLTAQRLDDMVAAARKAGQQVALEVRGEPRPLPKIADQAVYRVLQEGLTNTRKHAPGAPVEVVLDYAGTTLSARISNDAPHQPVRVPGGGQGLAGLSERIRHAGGTLDVRRRAGGGFVLEVRLPYHSGGGMAVQDVAELDDMLAKVGAEEWIEPRPKGQWVIAALLGAALLTVLLFLVLFISAPSQ